MIIRWMGAYRKKANLNQSLVYELNRPATDEVAAELIMDGRGSRIYYPRVGLLVSEPAAFKVFNGDCFSEYENNRLVKTRNPRGTAKYREAWCHPVYTAIVVKRQDLPKQITRTLKWVSETYDLPIYRLSKKGNLKEIALM